MKLAVCIPCFNEAAYLSTALGSLSMQADKDFKIFICDNNSTDQTAEIALKSAAEFGLNLKVVTEKQKGTGAAADTAFRAAITEGFDLIARTDADAVVSTVWTQTIREHFARHPHGLASGVTGPIKGELSYVKSVFMRAASLLAATFGLLRPSNYGGGRKFRYVMTNGNNLAIDALSYQEVGGFKRTAIEELHEDRALVNDLRAAGIRVVRVRGMRVGVSSRRINAWGLLNSLRWYANHSYRGREVDVR